MIPRPDRSFYPPFPEPPVGESIGEQQLKMLVEENARLRDAGSQMAIAALRVATEYDGIHRLMLAVSVWAKAMADEHGRGAKEVEKPHG